MVMAYAVDSPITRLPALRPNVNMPRRPQSSLAAVMLDDFNTGSELEVAIDADDIMTVQIHANGLDASGAAHATTWRFQNQSVFALADIAVIGYDSVAERCVNGKISIGLTWNPPSSELPTEVAGSALAEGNWVGGLFRFNTVASHSFSNRVIHLVPCERFPSGSTRFSPRRERRSGAEFGRLGANS